MVTRNRIGLLVAFSLMIFALVVLSAGLSQVEFHEGKFLDSEIKSELRALLAEFKVYQELVLAVILIGALIIFVWSVLANKRTMEMPRSKSKLSLLIQIILWAIAILLLRRQIIRHRLDLTSLQVQPGADFPMEQSVPTVSNSVPQWFAFLFSLALILVIVFILWWIYIHRKRPAETIELLVQEAQIAIENLETGDDLRNVILRCYYQMARILRDQKGILRKQAMTPREFEQRLIELGLPGEPIGQLTQLFEAVRYGAKELGDRAELRAIACLDAIVRAGGGVS
jgi:hypothetical protein